MKVFSVMTDGNNEVYVYADNEKEDIEKYIICIKSRVKATSLDKILDRDEYNRTVKEILKTEDKILMYNARDDEENG